MLIVIADAHDDPGALADRRDRFSCDSVTQTVSADRLNGVVVLHPDLRNLKVSHAREDYERVRVIGEKGLLVAIMRCAPGGLVEWLQPAWLSPERSRGE